MISARTRGGARMAARLAAKARRLGEARAEQLRRRDDPRRLRRAWLLWPLFAKEP